MPRSGDVRCAFIDPFGVFKPSGMFNEGGFVYMINNAVGGANQVSDSPSEATARLEFADAIPVGDASLVENLRKMQNLTCRLIRLKQRFPGASRFTWLVPGAVAGKQGDSFLYYVKAGEYVREYLFFDQTRFTRV